MPSTIPPPMTSVRLEHLRKQFGQTVALDDINLDIAAGELFFLLGPSGCGKTTLLRIIAGLLHPTSGRILFNDRDVTQLGTEKRNAVMCFQSYALWPHMSVRENIRFGLRVRKMPADLQRKQIDSVLKLVQMQQYADRRPNELSGGQQQRVALARALAVNPACLLLDEPLSNLDAKLRLEMRSEIRRICKSAGYTTIYVTHDQKEALSVADRIAVLKEGRLVQVGTPADLYHRPANSFVADFIGQTNLIAGIVVGRQGDLLRIETPAGMISAKGDSPDAKRVVISIRPEQIHLSRNGEVKTTGQQSETNILRGKLDQTTFLGESSEHVVSVNGQRLKAISSPPLMEATGEVGLQFSATDVMVLPE